MIASAIFGMVGSGIYVAYRCWNSEDFELTIQKLAARLVLGGGAALIAYLAGLPNSLNSILIGMVAPEFIEGVVMKYAELHK